jgi:uroporphyrinogen-III synthase
VAIASVGGKTSALLHSLGHTVTINGEGKGSISEVAKAFQEWLDDRVALFPVSTKSLGTISKGIPSRQAVHVECYETEVLKKQLANSFDVYVFTSPSNVEGFFQENNLPAEAKVIAWGESTERALKEVVSMPIHVLNEPTFEALIDAL